MYIQVLWIFLPENLLIKYFFLNAVIINNCNILRVNIIKYCFNKEQTVLPRYYAPTVSEKSFNFPSSYLRMWLIVAAGNYVNSSLCILFISMTSLNANKKALW